MRKNRKVILAALGFLLTIGLVAILTIGLLKPSKVDFVTKTGHYISDKAPISSYERPTASNTIELRSLYTINGSTVSYNNKTVDALATISISSAEELYAFSKLTNANDNFLAYNYKLLSNINYENYPFEFEPVAWGPNKSFTGSFDGNGYEISNLNLTTIDKSSSSGNKEVSKYEQMQYYAMFSRVGNGGNITKLGLRDTNIVINGLIQNMVGVAPLIGLIDDGGSASYLFATDLRDPIQDESGITAMGGYRISGLVFENRGELLDSYSAYNIVSNYTVDDYIDFNELLTVNTGTINNNLYFYNRTISDYIKEKDSIKIVYGSPVSKTFTVSTHFGVYKKTLDELNQIVIAENNNWYSKNSYPAELRPYLDNMLTPIIRGIKMKDSSSNSSTFIIANEADFSYMFELMNLNDYFASMKMVYEITTDLNLSLINRSNYFYERRIAATIRGASDSSRASVTIGNAKSSYPTIYYGDISKGVTTEGIDAFGLFPVLAGEVSNLNIVMPDEIGIDNKSDNIKAIGVVTGYLNGGSIDNVNVLANIRINNSIGKYFVGGMSGVIAGEGVINNSTATGNITVEAGSYNGSYSSIGYMNGSAVGGLVGYITDTYGSLSTSLNTMNIISAGLNSKSELAIGGVVGAGYSYNFSMLENRGNISVGSGTNVALAKELYVGGIIGRLLGVRKQIAKLNNQGDIEVYNADNLYLAGILNADIKTSNMNNLTASSLRSNGKYAFYLSEASNSGTITQYNNGTNTNLCSGLNLLSKNGFISELSGIYNLGYKTYDNKTMLPQKIDMSIIPSYSGVINSITGSIQKENQAVSLQYGYNLRDIEFFTSKNISFTSLDYSGIGRGNYISYYDSNNEGNITLSFAHGMASGNIYINGAFSGLDNGFVARNIFNDGDILIEEDINNRAPINANIYASGITYSDLNSINQAIYNPLSPSFDNKTLGSLNNAINNGSITITSDKLTNDLKVNSDNYMGNLNGNIFASGILAINKGILTNSFNLGNIYVGLFRNNSNEIYASGISYSNEGEYAQIRDCANNGIIKAINIGLSGVRVTSSGITAINTKANTNNHQVIAFTINYGEIYAFSGEKNDEIINSNENVKASGILAFGIANIVNTINYGNVFSTNVAGGMIAAVNLDFFDSSKTTTIANTLNYGVIKAIKQYENDGNKVNYASYGEIKGMKPDSKYIDLGAIAFPYYQAIGALIGVLDYSRTPNLVIRYLINFYEYAEIVAKEPSSNGSSSVDVSKLINIKTPSYFLGKLVTYAPLSTESNSGVTGVFSPEFIFRRAIRGEGLDSNFVTDKYIGDFFQFVAFEKINTVILDKIGWRQIAYMDAAERFARDLGSIVKFINLKRADIVTIIDNARGNDNWINVCDTEILRNLLAEAIKNNYIDDKELDIIINYILFETGTDVISSELRSTLVDSVIAYIDSNNQNVSYYKLLNKLLYDEVLAKILANNSPEYKAVADEIRRIIETTSSTDLEVILNAYMKELETNSTLLNPLFSTDLGDYYFEPKLRLINTLLEGYSEERLKELLLVVAGDQASEQAKYIFYINDSKNDLTIKDIYAKMIASNSFNGTNEYSEAMNIAFKGTDISDIISKNYNANMQGRFDTVINSTQKSGQDITSLNITPAHDYVELWNTIKNDKEVRNYLLDENNGILTEVIDINGRRDLGIYAKATEFRNTYQTQDAPNRNGKGGIVIDKSHTAIIRNRFIYEPDYLVNDDENNMTYYYGPYETKNSNVMWNNNAAKANQNFDIGNIGNSEVDGSRQRYVPFFASVDKTELTKRGVPDNRNFEFYWNNDNVGSVQAASEQSQFQWVSTHIINNAPLDGTTYLKKVDSGIAVDHNYDFGISGRTARSEQNIVSNSNDFKNGKHINSSSYLVGHITANLITGIWYQHDIWIKNGAYLTAKRDNFINGFTGVQTTEYINYFLEDLIKLDGKTTKGRSKGKASSDEENIINALMEKLLSKEAGKKLALEAVGRASVNGFDESSSLAAEALSNALAETEFTRSSLNSLTYNNSYLNNIIYSGTDSIKGRLDFLIRDISYSTKEQIILNTVNNQEAFRQILLKLYSYSKKASEIAFEIEVNNRNNYIYEYIKQLKRIRPNITDDEITGMLKGVNDSDLTIISTLLAANRLTNQNIDGFNINGEFILKDDNVAIAGESYNSYIEFINAGTITVNSLTNEAINIAFLGKVNCGGDVREINTAPALASFDVANNQAITINVFKGTKIYGIFLSDKLEDAPYINDFNSGNVGLDNQNGYELSAGSSITITKSLALPKGTTATLMADVTGNGASNVVVTVAGQTVDAITNNEINYKLDNNTNIVIQNNGWFWGATISNLRVVFDNGNYTFTQMLNNTDSTITLKNPGIGVKSGTSALSFEATISPVTSSVEIHKKTKVLDLNKLRGSNTSSIEEKFNANMVSLSDVGRYTLDKIIKNDSKTIVNITKPSYVIVECNGSGNITLNNENRVIDSTKRFYAFYIGAIGQYEIAGSVDIVNNVYILNEAAASSLSTTATNDDIISYNGKEYINFDYSSIGNFDINALIPTTKPNMGKYDTFIEYYPYQRNTPTMDSMALFDRDLKELIYTLFPTIKNENGQWKLFENKAFTNDILKELVRLVAKADYKNSSLSTEECSLARLLHDRLLVGYRDDILTTITKNSDELLVQAILRIRELSKNNEGLNDLFRAAFLGNDFINNMTNQSLDKSKLKEALDKLDPMYQFITGANTIDNDKFINLMKAIGFNLSTDGYGIYALSSSKGILNGAFIPDNLVLDSMDSYYDENNILVDNKNSAWRGGTSDNSNNATAKGTVNHSILVEMKQLKKSISTTIFNLDLRDSNNRIHHSAESQIDLENKTITYYVPNGYIAKLSDKSLSIENKSIANMAGLEVVGKLELIAGRNENVIKVTAEDVTVVSYYSIIFKEIDISYDISYEDNTTRKEMPSAGGVVTIILRSPATNDSKKPSLPANMDIKPYISIKNSNGEIIENTKAFEFVKEDGNGIIDARGQAIIKLNILQGLAFGEYELHVAMFDYDKSLSLNKLASSDARIISFIYDGKDLANSFKNINGVNELTTMINYGRAFDYNELTAFGSSEFYLNKLEVSHGSKIVISAIKKLDSANIMSYEVTYIVTAEDGTNNTYVHKLVEKHPFKNYLEDGSTTETKYSYATVYTNGNAKTYEYNDSVDSANAIRVEFERGEEPQYSVKYALGNFYTEGVDKVSYAIKEETPGGVAYLSYAGMTITVTHDCEAGVYKYTYSYKSKGLWSNGEEYMREYDFPELIITKNYSTDSTLHKISFLDAYATLGDLATVINPMNPIRPSKNNLANGEVNYFDIKSKDYQQKISMSKKGINYKADGVNDYSGVDITDYFTVGAISNATLYDYAPSFKLEEHAEIYQSTTLSKLKSYGEGKQTRSDAEVLKNHDTLFIYVPYVNNTGEMRIFLVEVINGKWGKVYPDTYSGEGKPIATLTENKGSFVIDEVSWKVDLATAGKPLKENYSLYMDYIGTPLDDHFWYVSYVVFSESYLNNPNGDEHLKYYHVALIDTTNNIFFDLEVKAPVGFKLDSLFVTIAFNRYGKNPQNPSGEEIKLQSNQVSGYVVKKDNTETLDYLEYYLDYDIQVLPSGYFYFFMDLPIGYVAEARVTNGKLNQNNKADEPGAYLPPSSIVTQRIKLEITIKEDLNTSNGKWGASIADIFTRQVKFIDK